MAMFTSLPLNLIAEPDDPMRRESLMLGLGQLIQDIAQNGLLQPIAVRDRGNNTYYIIFGHRRYLAHKEMGREQISCFVYVPGEGNDDEIRGSENLQRNEVNPIEEALFYRSQMEKYQIGYTEVARRYQRSPSFIQQSIALLDGDGSVLAALRDGAINKSQAKEINLFSTPEDRAQALTYALNNGMTAQKIKEWREYRKDSGIENAVRQVQPIIEANGHMLMQTNLLCSFCRDYFSLTRVQSFQIHDECYSELEKATAVYNPLEATVKEKGLEWILEAVEWFKVREQALKEAEAKDSSVRGFEQ